MENRWSSESKQVHLICRVATEVGEANGEWRMDNNLSSDHYHTYHTAPAYYPLYIISPSNEMTK